jgi:uncharacterized protein (TIGR00369 family)
MKIIMNVINNGIDAKLFDYLVENIKNTSFYNFLGIELKALGPGTAEFILMNKREHTNIDGVTHGGVIMSLADAAMANAVRTMGSKTSTVDFTTSFLNAAPIGEIIRAEGKIIKRGRRLVFTEGNVYAGDKLVGSHNATFYRFGELNYE